MNELLINDWILIRKRKKISEIYIFKKKIKENNDG